MSDVRTDQPEETGAGSRAATGTTTGVPAS